MSRKARARSVSRVFLGEKVYFCFVAAFIPTTQRWLLKERLRRLPVPLRFGTLMNSLIHCFSTRYQWNGMPVSMITTQPSELCSSVPPCQHCGANRVFEVQFMPALIGHLKVPRQQDLSPKNIEQENETGNNKCDLQSLNNSFHGETGEILTEDTKLQQNQRKTFMAAVNQKCDVTIEFGTVMVFACSKSCWTEMESVAGEAVYFEEFCLVEADPDATLFE